jgi:hypothetical protein
MVHKRYFEQGRVNHSLLLVIGLLVPVIWLGWKASGEKWISKMALNIVELVSITFSTFFRRMLMNSLNKYLTEHSKKN